MQTGSEKAFHSDEMTTRDYLRVVFRQRSVIILAFLTVVGTVYLGLSWKTPVYESQVKMLISAEKQVETPYYKSLGARGTSEAGLTQSEIVRSKPVLERVVRELALQNKPDDYEQKYASRLKSFFLSLMARWRLSPEVELPEGSVASARRLKAIEDLRENIRVDTVRDTNIFTITVSDFDPVSAAEIANVVSRSYVIYDLEQQLAELQMKYGDKHPTVMQLRDNIAGMSEKLSGKELSDNTEAIGPGTVKIIEQASIPLEPVGTRKILILGMAAVMGLFLGVILAFTIEYMDPSIRSSRDIESQPGLSLLGSIPRRGLVRKILIHPLNIKTRFHYHRQLLFDQIYLTAKEKQLTTLLITSIGNREGAAAVLYNLGLFLAHKAGQKVLLLDADFRNPALHKQVKTDNLLGMTDVIDGKVSLSQAVQVINDRLHVMTAGKAAVNPVIALDSVEFRTALQTLKKDYDLILMHCPNLRGYKEPYVISALADATIVVVNEGQTRRQALKIHLQPLREKSVGVAGVILNKRTFPIPRFVYERV